ncbi:MAG: DUF4469 domain-containing protein [Cyclobacteriaceae bacterium]
MKYYLVDNPLTPDPTDYRAETKHDKVYTLADLQEMITHRSVGLTDSQVASVLEELAVAIVFSLRKGGKIITPLFKITPTVAGVFTSRQDAFDRSRHHININLTAGSRLKRVAEQIDPVKVNAPMSAPVITEVFDKASGTTDEQLTPRKIARLYGTSLKFDENDPQQGIYLIQLSNKQETKVDTTDVIDNVNSKLTFQLPDVLPDGEYTIEVRTDVGFKEVRTGRYADVLTVGQLQPQG